jgi:hypothetical protein
MSLHEILVQIVLPYEECMRDATHLYMHCTYTDAPDRHECKRMVNKWLRELAISDPSVRECTRTLEWKERPTMIVPLEWNNSGHVMYRSFAPSIRQLRKRFNLIGMCGGENTTIDTIGLFDKMIHIGDHSEDFSVITDMIHAEEPDIIFYPSVGMAAWVIMLSTLRLAPMQFCVPGHPASTFSPVMDYMFLEESGIGDMERYSEEIVSMPSNSGCFERKPVELLPADRSGKMRVAIMATAIKIIPPFLHALKAIKDRCPDIEYHFFTHHDGLAHYKIEYELKKWFPDAMVYYKTTYEEYMQQLNGCSFGLTSFPFTAANSILDCFVCGFPALTIEGNELSERMGAIMLRRLGLPERLIAHSVDEYVNEAVYQINGGVKEISVDRTLLDSAFHDEGRFGDAFLHAVESVYEEAACVQTK